MTAVGTSGTLGLDILFGAAVGAYDVAINTAGAPSQAGVAQPIMNRAPAGFSIGVVATNLSVGVVLDRGW